MFYNIDLNILYANHSKYTGDSSSPRIPLSFKKKLPTPFAVVQAIRELPFGWMMMVISC